LAVEKTGGGDIRLRFNSGTVLWGTAPADEVTLTEGSDTSPQINYAYFLESTGALTVSTTGFPTSGEYCPIATVICQSAATLQTDGAYSVHSWNTPLSDSENLGTVSHLVNWVRNQSAVWLSGAALTPNVTVNAGSEDNVDISTTAGVVLQLLSKTFPVFDTSVASDVYVTNMSGGAYTKITDLNTANEDDAGNTIGNQEWTNLVLWGIVSEDEADCKLMLNLPSGFHSDEAAAIADIEKYSNYVIPAAYKGSGFLIARLTFEYANASNGTWTLGENLDLRGSGATGGTGVASTSFADNAFEVTNAGDPTKVINLDATGITTGTTRTATMPDADVTLADSASPLSQFAATTSAQLRGVMSDETGTGSLVFATSPTLVTPTLGVATATSVNKVVLTQPATGATLTITEGKELEVTGDATIGEATVVDGTHSEIRLSTTASIDGKAVASTTLYTVPTGETCIITKAIIRLTTATGLSAVGTMGIGIAAGESDIFAAEALTGMNATTKTWTFSSSGLQVVAAADEVIKLGIDVGFTATTATLAVDLYGYLV